MQTEIFTTLRYPRVIMLTLFNLKRIIPNKKLLYLHNHIDIDDKIWMIPNILMIQNRELNFDIYL